MTWQASYTLSNPWAFPLHGVPLRVSVPCPAGEVREPARDLCLSNASGEDLGAQWRTLSHWPDGSVRFALLDYAAAALAPRSKLALTLAPRGGTERPLAPPMPIRVSETADTLTVDTGRLRWTLGKTQFRLATELQAHGRDWLGARGWDLLVEDTHGQRYRASAGPCTLTLEDAGPYRVTVCLTGDYHNPWRAFMHYTLRLQFTAGGSQVLLLHTIRNRQPGRAGQDLRRSWLAGDLALGAGATHRVLHTARTLNTIQEVVSIPENVDLDVDLIQTTLRHAPSLRENPKEICYSLLTGSDGGSHASCAPLLDLVAPGQGGLLLKLAMPEPNSECPMRLAADQGSFEVDFYPAVATPMHLGEGMGKTRDLLLNFHDETLAPMDRIHESANLSYPGVQGVPAARYRACQFADLHHTLVPQFNKYMMLEMKIDHLFSEGASYEKISRKVLPQMHTTGWRDHGDDKGFRGHLPEVGIWQYMNNEEDYLYCAMIDAWRKGRPYGGLRGARHLMDIDYMDFSEDPARDGAVCPHSTDHTNGESYPSHQWCQGLLYYYLGTGDPEALRIAKRIGDNLIWWITGPRNESLRYSGRESCWPLLSLAALYEVTGETRYRDAGMQVINELIAIAEKHGQLVWEYPPGSGILSSYMLPMTVNGIWDMYAATGDARVLELWKKVTQALIAPLTRPDNWGYLHFRNWHIKWPDLTTLARWYHLTGDRQYVDLGRNGLRLIMAGCPQPLLQEQSMTAMGYRHFILYLKLADEFGLINDDQCTLVW